LVVALELGRVVRQGVVAEGGRTRRRSGSIDHRRFAVGVETVERR
jgi:hypothetical protein